MAIKNIIYSNFDIDFENDPDGEANCQWLCDEREFLDIETTNGIIGIADIGLWNGRVTGFKEYAKIKDCLYSESDFCEWFVDGRGAFRSRLVDHDGTTYVEYRAFKENVSFEQKERFVENLQEKPLSKQYISKYTHGLGKEITAMYGW